MNIKESTSIRVRFNETDPLGIVWHGNYISYFEEGREDFGRKHGLSYLDVQRNGYVTPIVESSSKHLLPLKYGDVALVETTFVDSVSAKIIFNYKILNPDGEVACIGKTVQVFVDNNGTLALNFPPFFEAWKRRNGLLKEKI